ncbi:hypothetical protein [Domibacillus enclensis]|uniref:Antitoxin n=1 Tax=Domibacillus enclensis TaxID=1017273 RepID=A0A1N6W0H8_9BACI|nr:hypothetical protein [Domibacillus enclensis]OXS77814.1 hypothetical protein B1B05_09410 [Domibacillus enclensis]SIQ83550.1 hypothetical protein SAMN05443094_10434 [Domibacillus enclensis]
MPNKSKTFDVNNTVNDLRLNATDIADKRKLLEILYRFSAGNKEKTVLVQNRENPKEEGILISLEYFEELLSYKEAVQEVFDYLVKEENVKNHSIK